MCDQPRGVYDLMCLDCCARLVLSARPSKAIAGAMLAAIERMPGSPARDEVVEAVKAVMEGEHA
jgi:hypothetical protein